MRLSVLATLVAGVYAFPFAHRAGKDDYGNIVHHGHRPSGQDWKPQSTTTQLCSATVVSTVTKTISATSTVTDISTVIISTSTATSTITTTCGLPPATTTADSILDGVLDVLLSKRGSADRDPATSTTTVTVSAAATTTTTTITSSVVARTTVSTTVITLPSSFYLYATPVAMYAQVDAEREPTKDVMYTGTSEGTADIFSLDEEDHLLIDTSEPGFIAEQDNTNPEPIYFATADYIADTGNALLNVTCTISTSSDGSCPLSCIGPFDNGTVQSLESGTNVWDLGTSAQGGAIVFTPLVIEAGAP